METLFTCELCHDARAILFERWNCGRGELTHDVLSPFSRPRDRVTGGGGAGGVVLVLMVQVNEFVVEGSGGSSSNKFQGGRGREVVYFQLTSSTWRLEPGESFG